MATKKADLINSYDKLNSLLNNNFPDGEIMDKNPIAKIDEWIGTGWYLLNAVLSGSIFGGLPNRRSLAFAGGESTGKTFFAMSIVRSAQHLGYTPIYCDSEGAIDVEFARKLGVDTSKIRLQAIYTIEEMNHLMAQIIESFESTLKAKQTPPKVMLVLDSLGNLSSTKETTDSVIDGAKTRDMTKQQAIRKMFRVNGAKLAKLGIPFVVTNHTYDSMSMFTAKEISGGGGLKYNASIILMLSKGGVDKGDIVSKEGKAEIKKKGLDEKTKVGITVYVSPFKCRFARPIPIKLFIPFYKKPNPYVGLEQFLNWKDFGVVRGKMLLEKEYQKLSEADQKKSHAFEAMIDVKSGRGASATITKQKGTLYVLPSDTAKTIVVRHLGEAIPLAQLFTEKVFTEELLKDLDEKVIKPTFTLPDVHSLEDLAELEKELFTDEDLEDDEENIQG